MDIAKALILTGRASDDRPWPAVPAGTKQLFPIANRPILFHNLEALGNAGLLEAVILVERDSGAAIERAVGDGSDWGLAIRYAEYGPAVGLAGALAAGHEFLGGDGVLVQQGDALLRERMYPHLAAFARERLDALALDEQADGTKRAPRRHEHTFDRWRESTDHATAAANSAPTSRRGVDSGLHHGESRNSSAGRSEVGIHCARFLCALHPLQRR